MEEVVEAGKNLAKRQIIHSVENSGGDECGYRAGHHPDCPVGIVLSFTKNREAQRRIPSHTC